MSHTPFLIAGYGITWVAMIWYLHRLRRRERTLPLDSLGAIVGTAGATSAADATGAGRDTGTGEGSASE